MLSAAEVQSIAEELYAQHERKEMFVPFPQRVTTMDDACRCLARTHDRHVFGEIADTFKLAGLALRESVHAVVRGVGNGSAAGVCPAGRG